MENLIFSSQNRLQFIVYDQNTNSTFIQFPEFSDIKEFYKRIENKEVSRFVCSKMDRISQTFILALEFRNVIVFAFTQELPKTYNWNFNESSAFNFLFKIVNHDSKINWV